MAKETSSSDIPTPAGEKGSRQLTATQKASVMDAIDQMFAEFELVYHNQFHNAFNSEQKEAYAKKLWYSNLMECTTEQILQAAHRAIQESEYLPSIRGILKYLDDGESYGLPQALAAYLEACRAPSPKAQYHWSHPAVYYAGLESDWFFLANTSQNKAFPVFERNYQLLCARVRKGEQLTLPIAKGLEQKPTEPLSKTAQKKQLQKLRKETGI